MGLPVRWVVPSELRLPPSRPDVDLAKLARQYREHGTSFVAMPPLEVIEGGNGVLVIYDGVTRATRAHRYGPPGRRVPVVVTESKPRWDVTRLPRVS